MDRDPDHRASVGVRIDDAPSGAQHAEVLGGKDRALSGLHVQDTQVPFTGASNKTRSTDDANGLTASETDLSRVEETRRAARQKIEDPRSFEKELSLLRKEEWIPGEIDLPVVGLDLCEIRISRQIQR